MFAIVLVISGIFFMISIVSAVRAILISRKIDKRIKNQREKIDTFAEQFNR
jgi:hypothetical protein